MKRDILELLRCPTCGQSFNLEVEEENVVEVRKGSLTCGSKEHRFEIEDGIMKFATGFGYEDVQKEIEYENSTYNPDNKRLREKDFIAGGPESLVEVWPHIRNFGPDFRNLINDLEITKGHWVLDIGTASCWSSRILAERGANVVALDVNDADYYGLKAADIQFEYHDIYFERLLESMTHLPFADGSLDAVTCNASLHHTPDLPRTLREFHRVLKPGGAVGVANEVFVSVRHTMEQWLDKIRNKEIEEEEGSHHEIPYSEFEDTAEEAGFTFSYKTAKHVHEKLHTRFGSGLGQATVQLLDQAPAALKQLKSTVILLRKSA